MPVKDPKELNDAQDIVFANPAYKPQGEETFCNIATQDVLHRLGYDPMQGMTADEMCAWVSIPRNGWLIKPMADAQALANEGVILIALLSSQRLGQSHGHVVTLTTGQGDFSGKWNCKTPFCMNIGRAGTLFRSRGVNWAFQIPPDIYALVSTL